MARYKFHHQFIYIGIGPRQTLRLLGLEDHIVDLLHLRGRTGETQLVLVVSISATVSSVIFR